MIKDLGRIVHNLEAKLIERVHAETEYNKEQKGKSTLDQALRDTTKCLGIRSLGVILYSDPSYIGLNLINYVTERMIFKFAEEKKIVKHDGETEYTPLIKLYARAVMASSTSLFVQNTYSLIRNPGNMTDISGLIIAAGSIQLAIGAYRFVKPPKQKELQFFKTPDAIPEMNN